MKILIQSRSNLYKLGGGDKVQLESTAQALEKLGHQVTIANHYVSDLSDFDVVHLFNMQIEPHSFLIYMLHAQDQDKPVALSTIYWNPAAWKADDQTPAEVGGSRIIDRLRALASYKFKGVPALVCVSNLLRSSQLRHWFGLAFLRPSSGEATRYIKQCLVSGADIILPNGDSEGEMVQHDFAQAKRCLFVPNGVSDEFSRADPKPFLDKYHLNQFVLSVGRIESRKNTLALAQAAKQLDLPLVLIGNDLVEPEYANQIRKTGGKQLTIISEMPHDQLGSAYAAAKVHALVSWFETPGLSSLEAAVAGCTIVSTEVGTTREYFRNLAYYCNPHDYNSIVSSLKAAWAAPRDQRLRDHVLDHFTWEDTALATLKGYELAGAKS